jgi:UDP-N-acetylglucosamine 2-epimerase
MAVKELDMPTIMLWPNADAGSEDVARGMRKFREHFSHDHIRFYKNFPVETFVRLMLRTSCMVGNSSAVIREGAFLGVPAVNIGTRQTGRERGDNVVDAGYNRKQILDAIKHQTLIGRFPSNPIYGDGRSGERIADTLADCEFQLQKRMTY